VGVELFHADGRSDMIKLLVAFHNLANAIRHLKNHEFHVAFSAYINGALHESHSVITVTAIRIAVSQPLADTNLGRRFS
jgi:hypothetical protein